VDLDVNSNLAIVDYCQQYEVDLVIVGPEAPLVAGVADDLNLAGIACFGPSGEAAQLEGSKSFARDFAARHGIPGPVCESFTEVDAAMEWLDHFDGPVVVKADGLAAGKGVIVPETRVETERAVFSMLAERSMGQAGDTLLLEERLMGEEISLFGIADGTTVIPLVTAQDHKRVGEGNTGLNTGGMGAFAPVPGIGIELARELTELFLDTAIEGMAADGMPYVGVLYAGIMLTDIGPRLVEYNCRFGDPEAQVIVPLIDSDLLDLLYSAATGALSETTIQLSDRTAAAIVVAADGYPTSPRVDVSVPSVEVPAEVQLIHSGTRYAGNRLVSAGGRVLSVVGTGDDLAEALDRAYPVVNRLTGSGLFARSDIGWRHAPRAKAASSAYAGAGVSLAAGSAASNRIAAAVASTHNDRVLAGHGSFGGVFDLSAIQKMDGPLLVASTDGVGTKTILAEDLDCWEGVGADIVNHGINDVLVQGARPLFFLDTVASAELDPEIVGRIVDGMAEACREAGCVLLGGETAEMPDVLSPGAVDIAGTMIGVVERQQLLPTDTIAPGHKLIGLASSGLHTNGYSLARKVFSGMDLEESLPGGAGETIGEALLAVHRSYLRPLSSALDAGLVDGLAHLTGGGFIDNIPRVLPAGCGATVDPGAWKRPVLFNYLIARAGLDELSAHQVFNCGIGIVAVVAPDQVKAFQDAVSEETWILGEVTIGKGVTLA
ncbi:MAG: phosphoribosylamine--glycine ligase, partial [Actinomycetia bacterium]|nr:phosphoribosylamine--glycine ligase [Actinomycetes bacterium]